MTGGALWPKTVNSKGEAVDYGILLVDSNQLSKKFPTITSGFRAFHKRRSKTITSHPLDKKTGTKTTIVTGKDQKDLSKDLFDSLSYIIPELDKLLR